MEKIRIWDKNPGFVTQEATGGVTMCIAAGEKKAR
jgi:hypothetical protein